MERVQKGLHVQGGQGGRQGTSKTFDAKKIMHIANVNKRRATSGSRNHESEVSQLHKGASPSNIKEDMQAPAKRYEELTHKMTNQKTDRHRLSGPTPIKDLNA